MKLTSENIKKLTPIYQPTKAEELRDEENILTGGFVSEIQQNLEERKINRKDLAIQIGTSPSYLTQVFRGDKPLNFKTLAKIQKALNIRFEIQTISLPNKQRKNTSKKDYANFS